MKKHIPEVDLSLEMRIENQGDGVKLVRGSDVSLCKQYTVAELLALPCNIYLLDANSKTLLMNETFLTMNNFSSVKDALYKSVFDYTERASALAVVAEDKEVMASHRLHIFDTDAQLLRGPHYQFLTFKRPWLNAAGETIGVLGCSIAIGVQPLAESLYRINELGFLVNKKPFLLPSGLMKDIYLSRRETECLQLLVYGNTAKEIAKSLGLSPRTIEQYLENLKIKFNVSTKSQLIHKAIEYFSK